MAFSDFPDPTRQCYPSASEYLQYLHDYAKHFDILKHMQYNTEVLSAELQADNTWILQVQSNLSDDSKPRSLQFDALVVATGAHHEPNKDLPVLEGYRGQIIHSNQYDEAFKRHVAEKKLRVMVIGGGESAADLSSELGDLSSAATIWLRRPHCFGPRYLNNKDEMEQVRANKSVDFPTNGFLEAATTNRMSAAQNVYLYGLWRRILWRMPILNKALNLMCIDATTDAFFLNDQATFVTKNQRMCEAALQKRIEVLVSPSLTWDAADGKTAQFADGQRRTFDAIVLCTGYRLSFPWIKTPGLGLDDNPSPRSWFLHCVPPRPGHGLFFVGYARPHQGGIPPMAEMQARYVAGLVKGDAALPSNYETLARHDEAASRNYYYISPDLNSLVDYAAFLENVARRVGCEPYLPAMCVLLFNLHMASVAWMAWTGLMQWQARGAAQVTMASLAADFQYPALLWVVTVVGFLFYDDGLLIKWWLYPQWPVWYRQRGPHANPALLKAAMKRVPLWKSTAITRGFVLLLVWSIPTFYLQRFLSFFLFVPHLIFTALGVRYSEVWGGLLRPKMVVLHSGIWRAKDLFMP